MLNQAYTAVRQTQEKNFPNSEFLALKKRFAEKNLHIEVEIASASVWSISWNLTDNTFSGVVDLSIKPKLVDQHGVAQYEHSYSRTFRLGAPLITKASLKERFLAFMLDEIKGLQSFVDGC